MRKCKSKRKALRSILNKQRKKNKKTKLVRLWINLPWGTMCSFLSQENERGKKWSYRPGFLTVGGVFLVRFLCLLKKANPVWINSF